MFALLIGYRSRCSSGLSDNRERERRVSRNTVFLSLFITYAANRGEALCTLEGEELAWMSARQSVEDGKTKIGSISSR